MGFEKRASLDVIRDMGPLHFSLHMLNVVDPHPPVYLIISAADIAPDAWKEEEEVSHERMKGTHLAVGSAGVWLF